MIVFLLKSDVYGTGKVCYLRCSVSYLRNENYSEQSSLEVDSRQDGKKITKSLLNPDIKYHTHSVFHRLICTGADELSSYSQKLFLLNSFVTETPLLIFDYKNRASRNLVRTHCHLS
jgi:hypothetical protein